MSITDELREYANSYNYNGQTVSSRKRELTVIADRIDREHRMALEKVAADAFLDGTPTEAQLEELGYIALPLDADSVPIRIGDEVDSDHYEDGTVVGIQYFKAPNGVVFEEIAVQPNGWDTATWRDPEEYRHHHVSTVEDVLREFAANIADVLGGDDFKLDDNDELYAEYATKLRLAEEVDE